MTTGETGHVASSPISAIMSIECTVTVIPMLSAARKRAKASPSSAPARNPAKSGMRARIGARGDPVVRSGQMRARARPATVARASGQAGDVVRVTGNDDAGETGHVASSPTSAIISIECTVTVISTSEASGVLPSIQACI